MCTAVAGHLAAVPSLDHPVQLSGRHGTFSTVELELLV